ncbi:hypothetical protein ACET3Z_014282 [Daucus carota]
MFPSGGYVNVNTPAFTENDFNSALGIQDLSASSSSCFFHSSSPFNLYEDEAIYSQHLQAILCETNYQGMVETNNVSVTGNTERPSQIDVNVKLPDQVVVRKKMCKKDRHSKINTAHGPRDRRMRLSLEVARKFFWLQDLLGFDKASKTVEWLIQHSKIAIKELAERFPHINKGSSLVTGSALSTSDCDVVSGMDESIPRTMSSDKGVPSTGRKEKRTRSVRKPTFHPRAKESREKAREKARERTKEKRQQQQQLDVQQSGSLMSWRPFRTGEEPRAPSHNNTSNYSDRLPVEAGNRPNARKLQLQSQGIREDIVNISDPNNHLETGSCSPSALFNYHQQINFWNFS